MQKEIDYGVLTDISKGLNCTVLQDCTDTTISRRTTKGFKNVFGLDDSFSDQNAEHIVHGLMVTTAACLLSNNNNSKAAGVLMLAGLICFYQNR